jgi:hypothetical protein
MLPKKHTKTSSLFYFSGGKLDSTEIFYCKRGTMHGFYRKLDATGRLEGKVLRKVFNFAPRAG